MTDFVPSPGLAGDLPPGGGAAPFAPAPPATTINDFAADHAAAPMGSPIAAAPLVPAAIPAPPRTTPRRNNAAMAVGIGGIVVAMLGVIAFILIRQDRNAEDEEAEVATIALPPEEPAPVASAPTEPPAATDPGLAEPPPEPAATTPPPATAPPKTTAPPKSTTPPKPPPSSTAPPKGSSRPPGERPKIKVIPRPGGRPPSDKPGSSSSGGGTTKRPKLVVKPK